MSRPPGQGPTPTPPQDRRGTPPYDTSNAVKRIDSLVDGGEPTDDVKAWVEKTLEDHPEVYDELSPAAQAWVVEWTDFG